MRTILDVGFVDTSADQLTWHVGLPPMDALARAEVAVDGTRVELRLLGASHQVLVHGLDGIACSETVACLPGGSPLPGPDGVRRENGHRFRSMVVTHRRPHLGRLAQALVARLGGRPDALVGEFAGEPEAVTAMLAERLPGGGVGWHTWHTYPRTGQMVTTATALESLPAAPATGGGEVAASWA